MSNLRITPITKKKREQEELRITPILTEEEKKQQIMSQSKVMTHEPAPQVKMTIDSINNKINTNINQKIISGGIENEIHNMNMKNIGKTSLDKNIDLSGKSVMGKTTPVDTSDFIYNDTGKKYGDYYYDNYELYKDMPIYEQHGKYYLKTNKGYEELGRLDKNGNVAHNVMTNEETEKEELEKAKKLGYKDNITKITTQDYDDAQDIFKQLKNEYKLSDKELNDWIKTGDLPIHVSIQTNSMSSLKNKAEEYRTKINSGKIKQYNQQGFNAINQLDIDLQNMSDEEKKHYISSVTGKKDPTLKNENTFFKSSESNNPIIATLGTIGNAGYSFLKGTGKFIEGTSDFAENLIGSGLETFASDKDKKDVKEFRNNTWNIGYKYGNKNYWYDEKNNKLYDENWNRVYNFDLSKLEKRYTYSNGVAEFGRQMKEQTVPDETSQVFDEILHGNDLRKASVLGTKSEAMLESMGQALPLMGAGATVGGLYGEGMAVATTSGLTFASTYGNAKTEAIRNGATEKEAMQTAFVQATAETISEQFFDAIPGAKSAGWGEKLVGKVGNSVEKYMGSRTAKIVTKALDISGEGFEEIISNMLTAGGNDIIHFIDKDFNYGMENQSGNILDDMTKAMTSQDSMDSFISAIITSALLNAGSSKINSSNENQIINEIVRTYAKEYNMSIDEAKNRLNINGDTIEFDTSNINQNQNTPNLPNNSAVEQRNINNNINNQVNENTQNSMSTIENNTQEKYSNIKPPMVIKYQATDNEKINRFRQSAVKEGIIDSQKTTNAMNVIEKVISDKDYNVRFDRTITNLDGKSVDGKININKNGEVEIALNPNSDRAVEFLLTHEITHAIETNELRGIILDYANKNSEFKSALQDLQKTYGTTNVSDEVIADISGQILGNQEFINSLSMQNTEQSRGIIKNIYHSIQRLLNKLTTKGRYRNFVEDLKTKWREAYRLATNETAVNNLKSDSKYAIANTKLDNSSFSLKEQVEIARKEFMDSKEKNGFDEKTKELQKKYDKLLTKLIQTENPVQKDTRPQIEKDVDGIIKDLLRTMDQDIIDDQFIDEAIGETKYYKDNYIDETDEDILEELGIDQDEAYRRNRELTDEIYDKLMNKLKDEGISIRYDENGNAIYDRQELAIKGYNELLDYLDDKNINYEVSRSSEAGYVPSIYIKNSDGEVILRIANHRNHNLSDYDIQVNEKYNKLFSDKEYANWKEKIVPKIEENFEKFEWNEELDNSSFSLKEKQLEIIKKNNPMTDDYHVGIRTVEDIKTPEEAFKTQIDEDEDYIYPDFTKTDGENALKTGKITVYSSYEIKQGSFVSPSKLMAQDYSGNGKVFEKTIDINDVAWIDSNEGQYAKVEQSNNSKVVDNKGRTLSKEQQEFFKDSKIRDENGNLLEVYHGTEANVGIPKEYWFTIFDIDKAKESTMGDGFYFTDDFERASTYAHTKGNVYKVYLNIKNPFIKGINQTFIEAVESINPNYDINKIKSSKGNRFDRTKLRQYLIDNGYDGISLQGTYVAFNPNQIKNVDNLNPTTNDDIRYSQKSQTWDEFVENNFKSSGTRTKFSEIKAPINPNAITNQNKIKPPIAKEYQKNTIEEKIEKSDTPGVLEFKTKQIAPIVENKINRKIEKSSKDSIVNATKIVKKGLDLSSKEKQSFKEKLKKFENKTYDEVVNGKTYNEIRDIIKEYSSRPIENIDEEMKSVKSEIKNRSIKIDDNLKTQITDYNDFRKSMFGKLKLSNEGISIDSLYNELSNSYPYYFKSNIETEADMLYELADFMNKDVVDTQYYYLTNTEIERYTAKVFNELKNGLITEEQIQEIREGIESKKNIISRQDVKNFLLDKTGLTIKDIQVGKDINKIDMNRTDPIRVNEKVFGYEVGKKINEAIFYVEKHNEADRQRWLNVERDDIKKLGIKPRSKESAAVQKYGEKKYINEYGEVVEYGDKQLASEFPDIKTQEKIKYAAKVLRHKYDIYIDQINNVLEEMGYKPIQKRADYFRHFQALEDVFSRHGLPVSKETLKEDLLPTDINGLTDEFKPGKQWFANAMKRTGMKTTYDAITGIDGYLEGASNLIFHTEDIQRYRAFSDFIRNTYGEMHGFDNLKYLTEEEVAQRIEDIQSHKLSKYVAWLDEQANALANKKGRIDRAIESLADRKIYNILNAAKQQVGSNMTGFNIGSALTNFASAVQGASKTNKLSFVKGSLSTIKNMFHRDNLIDKSDFLTSRLNNSQSIAKKTWQKARDIGQIFMNGTDWLTSNQIWRSKYFENIKNGMSEEIAIKNADDFAARIMGDRSKGATAQIFNSKTLGIFSQFQLEVNNQWSSLIHDNKMDIKSKNKTLGGVLFQTGQLFALSHLFNVVSKSIMGREIMLDPLEMLFKLLGWSDEDKDKTWEERTQDVLDNIVDNLPFANLITPITGLGSGGRIPISEAFRGAKSIPGITLGTEKDDYGNKLSRMDSLQNLLGSVWYWVFPTGYGQVRKTTHGLSMFINDKEIKGSYTKKGNLRFPVKDTIGNRVQAGLFGEYASKEARQYFNQGRLPLKESQFEDYKTLNIPISDYWVITKDLSTLKKKLKGKKTDERKKVLYKYIDSLDVSQVRKDILKKSEYKTYTDGDNRIIKYINNSNMSKKSKEEILKKLGLDK